MAIAGRDARRDEDGSVTEEIKYLRLTIDVAVFDRAQKLAAKLVEEGGPMGVGGQLARALQGAIENGYIEIDEVRDVEVH